MRRGVFPPERARPFPRRQRRRGDGWRSFEVSLALALALVLSAPLPAQIFQEAYVKASNPNVDDHFGAAVAISGKTLVIGAPDEDSNASGVNGNQTNNSLSSSGAAYVFVKGDNGAWTQQAYLKASDPALNARFGSAVAISGNIIAVGAPGSDSNTGAVHIFTRGGAAWIHDSKLTASNAGSGDGFGASVALAGSTLLAGAPNEASNARGVDGHQANNSAPGAGAAYVFQRRFKLIGGFLALVWDPQAYLKASNADLSDAFGTSVALVGNTAVIGAPGEDGGATGVNGNQFDNEFCLDSGAAYAFSRSGETWVQRAYLKTANPELHVNTRFGRRVAVSESGAATHDRQLGVECFGYQDIVWSPAQTLPGGNDDNENHSLALASETLLIGDPGTQARAPLYKRGDQGWELEALLRASPADPSDRFGAEVALSDDFAVIGAPFEDSSATGVNGNPLDNLTDNSGAAYVFNVEGPYARILSIVRAGETCVMDFVGPPGVTGWRIKGSTDLVAFDIDKTPVSTVTELQPGKYRVVTSVAGAGSRFFLRIEFDL